LARGPSHSCEISLCDAPKCPCRPSVATLAKHTRCAHEISLAPDGLHIDSGIRNRDRR
jgi:hypothetical protein